MHSLPPSSTRRFTCPRATGTPEQLAQLALARGRACFNHTAYLARWEDLKHLQSPAAAFVHWALFGRVEGRQAQWGCSSSSYGLVRGVDGTPAVDLERERLQLLAVYARHGSKLLDVVVQQQQQQQQQEAVAGVTAAAAATRQQGTGGGVAAAAAQEQQGTAAGAGAVAQQQAAAGAAAG